MKVLTALLLLISPPADAFERSDTGGLSIQLEYIDEPVQVDGLAIGIRVAHGVDVPELAARIERRWRAEGSVLRRLEQRGWRMLSRWHEGRGELIQWRALDGSGELLFSSLDASREPAKPVRPPFALPSACAWGRVIDGVAGQQPYSQRTAYCRSRPEEIERRLRALLAAQGWETRDGEGVLLNLAKDGWSGSVILTPGQANGECALVWVGFHSGRGKSQ